jgi:type IV pilus assembly protein PilC
MKERVSSGTLLSEAMKEYPGLYPKNVVSIVATGEKSGTLDQSFANLSEFYSKEVRNKTKRLPTIIEPALLIFIGLVIGFVGIAIIMPIYQLTRGCSQ